MTISNHYLDLMLNAEKASSRAEAIQLINLATKEFETIPTDTCSNCGKTFTCQTGKKMKQPCCYCRNDAFLNASKDLHSNNPADLKKIQQYRELL